MYPRWSNLYFMPPEVQLGNGKASTNGLLSTSEDHPTKWSITITLVKKSFKWIIPCIGGLVQAINPAPNEPLSGIIYPPSMSQIPHHCDVNHGKFHSPTVHLLFLLITSQVLLSKSIYLTGENTMFTCGTTTIVFGW